MESLILANETAVAEIRKHAKDDDKGFKVWSPKTGNNGPPDRASNPSITSTGIVGELVQQTSNQTTKKTGGIVQAAPEPPHDLTKDNGYDGQSMLPVSVVVPSLTPKIDNSKGKLEASVQDPAHIINQLLALFILIDGATGVDQQTDAPGMKKMTVEEQTEEIGDLFPKRSRPY